MIKAERNGLSDQKSCKTLQDYLLVNSNEKIEIIILVHY